VADSPEQLVRSCAELAHRLIGELKARAPNHSTFEQVGLLDGREMVFADLDAGERGCALDHLLYMVHEAAIEFPKEKVLALHQLADAWGQANHYSREKTARLSSELRERLYNAV